VLGVGSYGCLKLPPLAARGSSETYEPRPEGLASRGRPCTAGYRGTSSFPKQEIYGLTSQIRSVRPSNIAEAKGRFPGKELLQLLFHARGSLLGPQTEITFGCALGFLMPGDGRKLTDLASEVGRLLNGLVKRFQSLSSQGSRC
jgi:four helix bundle protein